MKRYRLALPVLVFSAGVLAGCDSPSPRLMSGERHEAEVEGSRFTIWQRGGVVEVYRTSPELLPRLSEVMTKASVAIRQTTGCAVSPGSMAGDAALLTAELDCG